MKALDVLVAAQHWQRVASATLGLAAAWSQLLAIRLLRVPIGVGVGIGIGIDSDCILWLVLRTVQPRYPSFVNIAKMRSSKALRVALPCPNPIFCPFDSDSDSDTDPDPDYNPYRDRDAFVLY